MANINKIRLQLFKLQKSNLKTWKIRGKDLNKQKNINNKLYY